MIKVSSRISHLSSLMGVVFLTSCVTTTGGGRRRYVDPTGVRNVDDGDSSPQGTPAERASIESLKTRIAVLEGEVEESKVLHQREVTSLSEQLRVLSEENARLKGDLETNSRARDTEDGRKAASLLWTNAVSDLSAGRYSQAQSLLKQLIDRYPEDPRAYQAHLATAMTLYAQKKFSSAAGGFAFVAQKYPSAEGIQMAWYGQGAGLYKMLKGNESLLFFKQTASRWPKSAEGKHAGQIVAKKSQPPTDLFLAFPNWLKDAPN